MAASTGRARPQTQSRGLAPDHPSARRRRHRRPRRGRARRGSSRTRSGRSSRSGPRARAHRPAAGSCRIPADHRARVPPRPPRRRLPGRRPRRAAPGGPSRGPRQARREQQPDGAVPDDDGSGVLPVAGGRELPHGVDGPAFLDQPPRRLAVQAAPAGRGAPAAVAPAAGRGPAAGSGTRPPHPARPRPDARLREDAQRGLRSRSPLMRFAQRSLNRPDRLAPPERRVEFHLPLPLVTPRVGAFVCNAFQSESDASTTCAARAALAWASSLVIDILQRGSVNGRSVARSSSALTTRCSAKPARFGERASAYASSAVSPSTTTTACAGLPRRHRISIGDPVALFNANARLQQPPAA